MLNGHVAILSLSALAILGSYAALPQQAALPEVEAADLPGPSLRTASDVARGRRWELQWDAVVVYDAVTNRPIRRMALEGAGLTHARGVCRPDMLLDRSGAVLVSSNSEPVLWRVSLERFVERFEVRVDDDHGRDMGFSALEWSPDGRTIEALDASTRSPWRIDLASLEATRVEVAQPSRTC